MELKSDQLFTQAAIERTIFFFILSFAEYLFNDDLKIIAFYLFISDCINLLIVAGFPVNLIFTEYKSPELLELFV